MNAQLLAFLRSADTRQRAEEALVEGVKALHRRHLEWVPDDHYQAIEDSFNKQRGRDSCYDLPACGFEYTLWYHLRRTNDCAALLVDALEAASTSPRIVDLGGGTGAGLWATALILYARWRLHRQAIRPVEYVVVDSSPFMLEAAQALWGSLITRFHSMRKLLTPRFHVAEWSRFEPGVGEGVPEWVVAAFLLHHSQAGAPADAVDSFVRSPSVRRAQQLFIASPQSKADAWEATVSRLCEDGWHLPPRMSQLDGRIATGFERVWTEQATRVSRYCKNTATQKGGFRHHPKAAASVQWNDHADLWVGILSRAGPTRHGPPAPFAGGVVASEDQRTVAALSAWPVIVLGDAGSGKTLVLAERVASLLERWHRDGNTGDLFDKDPPSILVTAYNRDAVARLMELVTDRLDATRVPWTRTDAGMSIAACHGTDGLMATAHFRTWDSAQTLVCPGQRWTLAWDKELPATLRALPGDRERLAAAAGTSTEAELREWITAELCRVCFGMGAYEEKAYLEVDRRGRKRALSETARKILWKMVLGKGHPLHHVHRRIDAHRIIAANPAAVQQRFSHILVDECQDFMDADWDIVHALLHDANARRVYAVGDTAQSVHAGKSTVGRPRVELWKACRVSRLCGSYRLPPRVAEALEPLFKKIIDANPACEAVAPRSMLGSDLGARPLVVVAAGRQNLAEAVARALCAYRGFLEAVQPHAGPTCAVFEPDGQSTEFFNALTHFCEHLGVHVAPEEATILGKKGGEFPCVIWNTTARIPAHEAVEEWVYTILTRTRCLLIVAVDRGLKAPTPDHVLDIVRLLRQDRVICRAS